MTSTPPDEGGPPDLVDTVAPAPPLVPQPAVKARRARWAAFEAEILKTVVLPKLRAVHAASKPTSIADFLAAFRAAHEPDISLADFQSYLDGLSITVRRITVFEGLEPSPLDLPLQVTNFAGPPRFLDDPRPVHIRKPRPDDDEGFDNEDPREFAPHDIDPFMPPEQGDALLNALGPVPGAFPQ